MTTTMHHNTPEITVLGQGGQALRQLRYCRTEVNTEAKEYISRSVFNDFGQLESSVDARFFGTDTSNFQYQSSLNDQVLRTDSVDAGISHILYDIEGRPMWQQDARGTTQCYEYDTLGRLTARHEDLEGLGTEAIRERLIYGENTSIVIGEAKSKNLRGQMVRHYDTAGLADHSEQGYALSGGAVQQVRQLLPVDEESDWQGEDETTWQVQLEAETYTTHWAYDAQGQVLQQTDAKGHVQDMDYDVQGRLKHSGVTRAGGTRQAVLLSQSYSAAGQKLHEKAGNGVMTEYAYEPETLRLLNTQTTRTDNTILQDLSYDYDPVGNIIAIADSSQPVNYFRSQQVGVSRTYTYDSLYQLVSATGRENAATSPAPVNIDNPSDVVPIDTHNYTNYTRNYRYDAGGNLHQIQHQRAQASYSRIMTVATNNNHAVRDTLTGEVGDYFDAAGNQRKLDTGQDLAWNGLNQLHRVSDAGGGEEMYQYAGDGMRIRKVQSTQASGATHTQEVIYLPGLELRRKRNDTTMTEDLEMLIIGAAGRSQVRLLNWVAGKPDGIDNGQLRYSLDDHLGSSQLELDQDANVLTREEYFPYGGTAVQAAKSATEVKYKVIRYSGKERDSSGLYYYGHRYYQPWLGRWLNPDPAGTVDGLNLYQMVRNNPISLVDIGGLCSTNSLDEPPGHLSVFNPQPPTAANLKDRKSLTSEIEIGKKNIDANKTEVGLLGMVKPKKPPLSPESRTQMTTGILNKFHKSLYYKGEPRFIDSSIQGSEKVETILVHGTFNPDAAEVGWARPSLHEDTRQRYGGKISAMQWSAKNHRDGRINAGKVLADRIKENTLEGIKTNIIAHSHGGNVAFEAIKQLKNHGNIDQLVTLGTPIRGDHLPSEKQIKERTNSYIHVYSSKDNTAPKGGIDFVNKLFSSKRRIGRARITTSLADTQIHIAGASHSELHASPVIALFGGSNRARSNTLDTKL